MLDLLLLIALFVVLSGLWAMIDAAVLSVTPAEIEAMNVRKAWGAASLKKLTQHLTRGIIVIVMLTNVTNILGPILIGQQAVALFGSTIIGIVTVLLTVTTIIFSEIVPKAIGSHYAPTISRISAPFLYALVVILYPLVIALSTFTRLFRRGNRPVGTEEQVRALVRLGGRAGHINPSESELIHRAFTLSDRTAKDIMMPRESIVAMPASLSVSRGAKTVFHQVFSRYPVYEASLDDIRGFVLSREILEALADGHGSLPLRRITRSILTVDPRSRASDMLRLMRARQIHIAIVVESGRVIGLVTLEDVLEELVGEIEDEGDQPT